jgi:hypothetical protein
MKHFPLWLNFTWSLRHVGLTAGTGISLYVGLWPGGKGKCNKIKINMESETRTRDVLAG